MSTGIRLQSCCAGIGALLTFAATMPAGAALTISGGVTKNVSCIGGVCTATAATADLNRNDLETMLASSNVQVVPGSVAMDIVVKTAVTWASGNALTLDAYRSLTIGEPIGVTGPGGLTILTNDGGSGGDYTFGPKGKVTFLGTSNSLTINGTAFTLLGSMSDVQNINTNLNGNYALANSYNAKHVANWIPLGTNGMGLKLDNGFVGTFEGIGNTISDLTVNIGSFKYAGLFGISSGTIRDINLVGNSVTGGTNVGGLVGLMGRGAIVSSYVSGAATGSGSVGGLVGAVDSKVASTINSHTSGTVGTLDDSDDAGGLIGGGIGSIANSYSTASVAGGGAAGGLVGDSGGSITGSYATGSVSGSKSMIGGLVGYNLGAIADSHATGAASGNGQVGGLVGKNDTSGVISASYAGGATTNAGGSGSGGLVGANGGIVENSYATGALAGTTSYRAGLIGNNSDPRSEIDDSYAIGVVNNTGSDVGGFVGCDYSEGPINDGYWDIDTSGIGASQGSGCIANAPGITGLTTAQFQSGLPSGYDPTIWAENPSINNGFPYLINNPPPH